MNNQKESFLFVDTNSKVRDYKGVSAYIMLIIGIIALYFQNYPILVSNTFGLTSQKYIAIHMMMYMLSYFTYVSPFMFLNDKWQSIVSNLSIVLILIVSVQHYIIVIDKPYLDLDLNNYPGSRLPKPIFT